MKKFIVLLLIFCIFICGCNSKEKEAPQNNQDRTVTYFEFNYGSSEIGYFEYLIKEDQYYRLVANKYDENNELINTVDRFINNSDMKKLSALVNKLKLYEWNDFNEKASKEPGGYTFNLHIEYRDKTYTDASGYMKTPNDYDEKSREI